MRSLKTHSLRSMLWKGCSYLVHLHPILSWQNYTITSIPTQPGEINPWPTHGSTKCLGFTRRRICVFNANCHVSWGSDPGRGERYAYRFPTNWTANSGRRVSACHCLPHFTKNSFKFVSCTKTCQPFVSPSQTWTKTHTPTCFSYALKDTPHTWGWVHCLTHQKLFAEQKARKRVLVLRFPHCQGCRHLWVPSTLEQVNCLICWSWLPHINVLTPRPGWVVSRPFLR